MNKYNTIFLITILISSLLPTNSISQNLSSKLESFKNVCIDTRKAIKDIDAQTVNSCKKTFSKLEKDIRELTLKPVSSDKEIPLTGHIVFHSSFLDSLLLNDFRFALVDFDLHNINRGESDIYVSHKVLPAGKTISYKYVGMGEMELLIVAENETDIQIQINSNGETHSNQSTDTKGLVEFIWTLPTDDSYDVVISITNLSDQDVSCAIASN